MKVIEVLTDLRQTVGQLSCVWEVPVNYVLALSVDQCINSSTFWLYREEWFLQIYYYGYDDPDDDEIVIYLQRKTERFKYRIAYTISLKIGSKVIQSSSNDIKFVKGNSGDNVMEVLKSKVLENVLDSSPMTIMCDFRCSTSFGEIAPSIQPTPETNEIETFSNCLESMCLNESLSDVKIKVGAKEFPAHKVILAARSPVFSSMFQHDMLENVSGSIDIKDCDTNSFEDFLKFIYTGKMDLVTPSNAPNLYKIAHKYEFKDLQRECRNRMFNHLKIDNVCDVLNLSVTYDEKELLEIATTFFIDNSTGIFKSKRWLTFFTENTSLANDLLEKLGNAYQGLKTKYGKPGCLPVKKGSERSRNKKKP